MALSSPVPVEACRWPQPPRRLATGVLTLVWLAAPAAWRQHGASREAVRRLLPRLPAGYGPARLEESSRGPLIRTAPAAPPVGLSLSYAPGWTLIGIFPGGAVGVDVARVEEVPDWREVAALYLGPASLARIAGQAAHRQARCFHREWARREALGKWAGTGLEEWTPERATAPAVRAFDLDPPGADHVAAAALAPGGPG